jgi:hypothetical protein
MVSLSNHASFASSAVCVHRPPALAIGALALPAARI